MLTAQTVSASGSVVQQQLPIYCSQVMSNVHRDPPYMLPVLLSCRLSLGFSKSYASLALPCIAMLSTVMMHSAHAMELLLCAETGCCLQDLAEEPVGENTPKAFTTARRLCCKLCSFWSSASHAWSVVLRVSPNQRVLPSSETDLFLLVLSACMGIHCRRSWSAEFDLDTSCTHCAHGMERAALAFLFNGSDLLVAAVQHMHAPLWHMNDCC